MTGSLNKLILGGIKVNIINIKNISINSRGEMLIEKKLKTNNFDDINSPIYKEIKKIEMFIIDIFVPIIPV